jgi:hypothetical protein
VARKFYVLEVAKFVEGVKIGQNLLHKPETNYCFASFGYSGRCWSFLECSEN